MSCTKSLLTKGDCQQAFARNRDIVCTRSVAKQKPTSFNCSKLHGDSNTTVSTPTLKSASFNGCVDEAPDNYYHVGHAKALIKQGAAGL